MTDALTSVWTGLAGMLIGAAFFGGLWWTVRRALGAKHAGLWFLGSRLARATFALFGFFFVADHHPERLLPCLIGFSLGALMVTILTRHAGALIARGRTV